MVSWTNKMVVKEYLGGEAADRRSYGYTITGDLLFSNQNSQNPIARIVKRDPLVFLFIPHPSDLYVSGSTYREHINLLYYTARKMKVNFLSCPYLDSLDKDSFKAYYSKRTNICMVELSGIFTELEKAVNELYITISDATFGQKEIFGATLGLFLKDDRPEYDKVWSWLIDPDYHLLDDNQREVLRDMVIVSKLTGPMP